VAESADHTLSDAVEISLPIHYPTVLRQESVAGEVGAGGFSPWSYLPPLWKDGQGEADVFLSGSRYLPKLIGLPMILEYPHGCMEQISTRALVYTLLGDLLASLPPREERLKNYKPILESVLKTYRQGQREDGLLPYWPDGDGVNPFATVLATWVTQNASAQGLAVPDDLLEKLQAAVAQMARGEAGVSVTDTTSRCFALYVLSQQKTEEDWGSTAESLYLNRETISDEARALLALAMAQLKLFPEYQQQLLRELEGAAPARAFDPQTFSSTTRADAMRCLARLRLRGPQANVLEEDVVKKRLAQLLDSSASFSTQENLWLLLAFQALQAADPAVKLGQAKLQPTPTAASPNQVTVAWYQENLSSLVSRFATPVPLPKGGSYLLRGKYRVTEAEARTDRGLRLERVVKNLTSATRTGLAANPYQLGDELLITYRLTSTKQHSYLALDDQLPAGLETINPNLAQIAKYYEIPETDWKEALALSHQEQRDDRTLLYFDDFRAGTGSYSVLARVTAAGEFRWPGAQVVPMYDSRFSGLSPASVIYCSGK
jgi:uncharacterized protein YfaS (alpha-2-macroglobulin family)